MDKVRPKFCCVRCKYFTGTNKHLKQHLLSKKHINGEEEVIKQFNCKTCVKTYHTKAGLTKHSKKCTTSVNTVQELTLSTTSEMVSASLHKEVVDNLQKIIIELSKSQKLTTINNTNTNYNNHFINVFLNDKCRNACDIRKFIAGIDFSKENYHALLLDYVGENAEIISKNYKSLPEHERPIYTFAGEDKYQKIAHIMHENKWIEEPEINWERQVISEQDDIEDDPKSNSMYSLVRLFDKKKMEYFDENYQKSHLYLSQRKLNKDCFDGDKQVKLINKIIEMARVESQ